MRCHFTGYEGMTDMTDMTGMTDLVNVRTVLEAFDLHILDLRHRDVRVEQALSNRKRVSTRKRLMYGLGLRSGTPLRLWLSQR